MKKILQIMVNQYAIKNYDWMNFKITQENPLTYHHIQKVELGGKTTFENGAALTHLAHCYLHKIESCDKDIYDRINQVLQDINNQKAKPTKKQLEIIELLLLEFETKYKHQLKKKAHVSKHKNYNPTEERKKLQIGQKVKKRC